MDFIADSVNIIENKIDTLTITSNDESDFIKFLLEPPNNIESKIVKFKVEKDSKIINYKFKIIKILESRENKFIKFEAIRLEGDKQIKG